MRYSEIEKRLAALEADVPPAPEELDPLAQTIASWQKCAATFEMYLLHRSGYLQLVDQGRVAWIASEERQAQKYGYRSDDAVLAYLRDVEQMLTEHGELAMRDAGYTVRVLDLVPEVRRFLRHDGVYPVEGEEHT